MSEQIQNLTQQIQQQALDSAKGFYGDALGQVKGQLESSRTELENLLEQLPEGEEAANEVQELVDSYDSILGALDEAAETQGVEDMVNGAAEQAEDTAEEAAGEAQETAEGAVEEVQDAAEGAAQAAENLAPGTQLLSEATDEEGQVVQRAVDESGDIIETTLDEAGELLSEDITGKIMDLEAEGEEEQDEEGNTIRKVRDESGSLLSLTLGEDGNLLDLGILESSEEETEEEEEGPDATEAAKQKAEELGVDLSQLEGTGADGRITVKDVMGAAQQ